MGNYLLYTRPGGTEQRNVDIGVNVVTYRDDPRVSFYHVPDGVRRFQRIQFETMEGSRKDRVDQAVIHLDGTRDSRGCFQVLVQRQLSTHIMIDWDGTVYQPLDLADVAWHAPPTNFNSVGIDLNNPVRPERIRDRPDQQAARGLFSGRVNGGNVAGLGYTSAQYESLIAVLVGLQQIFPKIKARAPIGEDGRVLRNKLVNPSFAGVVGHLHLSANKWDPGPGFDWERVLIGIRGNRMHFPVTVHGARNLSQVPKKKALQEAEAYFKNTENGPGGYFPVGINQAWHTGVHLHVDEGTPVVAPAEGDVVVARNTEPTPLGSANVVVIRHKLKIGGIDRTFFSVLSHLQQEELNAESEIAWIRRLAQMEMPPLAPFDGIGEPPASPGYLALKDGRVALCEVPVKAGEVVGHVGKANARIDGKGQMEPVLDFAVISALPIMPAEDTTFEIVDEDDDGGLLCNARSVWKRVTRNPEQLRGLVEGGYPLAPAEIRAFFSSNPAAAQLRWLAVRHVTEFSDKTDFSDLFGGGVDFEWHARKQAERHLARIRKFLWWDDNVTRHTRLPKHRGVYAYHPIALFAVLSMDEARRALTPDEDGYQSQLEGEELEKARRADAALEAEQNFSQHYGHIQFDDIVGAEDTDAQQDIDPEGEGWMRWEQGEWEP